jgi:hypothetical protein
MNNIKEVKKNYNIAKTLTPLLHASIVRKKDLKELFDKVNNSVEIILQETKHYKDLTNEEKIQISSDLYEIMSIILANEVITNDNTYIDEAQYELISILEKIPNFLKRIKVEDKEIENIIQVGLTYIIKESYMFHNSLYLADYCLLQEMRVYNLKTIKNAIKNISLLLNYIKENKISEKEELTSQNFKICGYIYSIGLGSLFNIVLKDPDKISDYMDNQEKYLRKVDKTFIENYGVLTKTTKIISKIIKNDDV